MMVIRKSISIRLLLGVLTLFGALTSCSQMDEIGRPADDAASTTEGNFYIQLSLEDSYGSQGSTRAVRANTLPEGYDSETPGTPTENAIRNLYLFFYDAETGKYITTVNVNPSQLIKDDYRYKMNLPEGIGTKMLIYCVANLANGADGNADPTVFQHDKAYETATMASVKTEYLDVINDFVPGSYGRVSKVGTDGAPSGILMSAQVTLADNCGSKVVDVSLGGTEEHPLHLKADLIHSVSKALVLVTLDKGTKSPTDGDYDASDLADRKGKEYDNPGPEYVAVAPRDVGEVSGGTLYAPYIGWIRKDEVKFIPGGVNKKLYFFPQQNGDVQMPAYKDPNMPLTDFMDFTQSDGKLVAEPKSDYGNEFIFHSGYDLHLQLLDDWMETAEAYDGTLWDNTIKSKDVSARYVNGMYFPENTFSLLDENKAEEKPYADALNAYSGGLPMVTNIHIAARLRPRKFGIPKNFVTKFQEFYNSYIAARTGTEDVRKAFEATLGGLTIQDLEKAGISSWVDHLPMINDHIKSIKDEDLPSGMSSDTKAVIESIADIYDSGSPDTTEYVLTMAQLYKNLWWYDDRHYTSLRFPSNTFLYYSGQTTTDASGKTTVVLPTLCFSADFYLMTADDVAELLGSTTSDSNVEAAWIFIETLKLQSVPHLGGWGYYFTYLDETGVTADYNGVTPYTASEVYRNRYYLINVTQINNAGGSVTDAEYIKTFTSPVNWQYAGKADVNLH